MQLSKFNHFCRIVKSNLGDRFGGGAGVGLPGFGSGAKGWESVYGSTRSDRFPTDLGRWSINREFICLAAVPLVPPADRAHLTKHIEAQCFFYCLAILAYPLNYQYTVRGCFLIVPVKFPLCCVYRNVNWVIRDAYSAL